ncbi:MFS transporter [Paraburkholderia caribensis]|uniref:MFS transporter n=1 Tax=Paraburkholderia caribensis TaxID=75105 RepID=UPI001CAC47A7|nr:MFS transporter [Paraburkholderia caribensis]CAG9249533.1 Drug resistance transporter, EmrB/QacA subfamily [Paraburkholderia caribensis]
MNDVTSRSGDSDGSNRRALLVLICTSAPSFMLQLDANIVSVSLPAIGHSLNANFAGIEWVISAYMLSFASLLLPAGALADRFGRKYLLIIGLCIFTAASFLCGAAPNLTALIAARALQGIGAAMQLSAALATLSHAFHGEARARAFAFWGTVVGIGMASGPVVGGLITQHFGWEWAFYVNLPIGTALIGLVVVTVESSRDPDATRIDFPGVMCFGGALFFATLALIEGNDRGWGDGWILAELACALLLFILFIAAEIRQSRPMLDLSYFLRPTYIGANLAQFSFAAGMLTMLTFIPVFLQSGLGYESGVAGLLMLPMVVPLVIVPRVVSRSLSHRLTGRSLLFIGLFVVALGVLWFAVFVDKLAYTSLLVGMLLTGVGAGLLNGETTKVGMTVIPRERAGMASGVSGTVRFTGLVIGVAFLGSVLYQRVKSSVEHTMPFVAEHDRASIVREITSGNLAGVRLAGHDGTASKALALSSFVSGYQALFLTAAALLTTASFLTWHFVRAIDTPPTSPPNRV